MGRKIVRAYHSMTPVRRLIWVSMLVLVLIMTTVVVAAAGTITFSNLTPLNGATIESPNLTISAYIKDSTDNLNIGTISMKIDGQAVSPSFKYKGYWVTDTCTGQQYWVTQTNKEGTVQFNATNLAHGQHTVELSISDKNGTPSTVTWSFNVRTRAETAGFSSRILADGSVTGAGKPLIEVLAAVTEGVISAADVQMSVDGEQVIPVINPGSLAGTYKISYTPVNLLNDGSHNVELAVSNPSLGTNNSTTWSFSVDRTPQLISLSPQDGASVGTTAPKISVNVRDTYDNLNNNSAAMKIDGIPVTPVFSYKGKWLVDTCTGTSYYYVQSYKEGILEYHANLSDGPHTAEISIADVSGNVLTKQWSFNVASKPVFSEITPADGTQTGSISAVSARVTDESGINPASIVMKINNSNVNYTYDPATGIIKYDFDFSTGNYSVFVSAADTSGNVGTAKWIFTMSDTAPLLKAVMGVDGKTITDGYLKFSAELTDVVDIAPDTAVTLNGQVIPANIRYDGYIDSCSGDYLVRSKKKVYINYSGIIPDGQHTLSLSWGNVFGYSDSRTWTVNVESKPSITNWQPKNYISDTTSPITVNVKDVNTGIDPASVVMKLNGQDVNFDYDPVSGSLTYTPAEALPNEAYYNVSVSAQDNGGLSTSLNWTFYISTYPEMADSGMESCSACHETYPKSAIPFQSLHKNVSFYGSHSDNRCYACHSYISYPAECWQCHGEEDGSGGWIDEAPHGSTPNIKYRLQNYDTTKAFRVLENREMWDCVICHQPNSPVLGWSGALVKPTRILNNHDIPELHKTAESSCNDCHALSLTREHAREGRVDQDGGSITCNTCHKSTDPGVMAAITDKNKNCSACHGMADHESLHTGDLDSNCQTCHVSALSQEHLNNPKTNPDKDYNCETCHTSSADNKVKRTIAANNLNCAGCHTQGHNILFVDKVPADIPIYSGFAWTLPIEASIFNGDTSTPAGYEAGQVVFSNRRHDITIDELWSYYNEQLTANGWQLMSDAPQPGAAVISAEFEKQARYVTVKCYSTELSDGAGPTSYGYRTEIWYK